MTKSSPEELSTLHEKQLIASPASYLDEWSHASTLTLPRSDDRHGGIFNVKQSPWEIRRVTLESVRSFEKNVLSICPVIDPKELDTMVTAFLRERFPIGTYSRATPPFEAQSAGQKRKRSFVVDERYPSPPIPNKARLLCTEEDALVLLAIALGRLCLRRGKISRVSEESEAQSRNHSQPTSNSLTSPEEDRKGSIHESASRQLSLPNVIMRESRHPYSEVLNQGGMADWEYYFMLARGTGEIGKVCQCQHVCNHISINLLVGYYYASIGHSSDSWTYNFIASRKIQRIVERSVPGATPAYLKTSILITITHSADYLTIEWVLYMTGSRPRITSSSLIFGHVWD